MFVNSLKRNELFELKEDLITESMYRPFFKQAFCYQKEFIQRTYQQTKDFYYLDSKNIVHVES